MPYMWITLNTIKPRISRYYNVNESDSKLVENVLCVSAVKQTLVMDFVRNVQIYWTVRTILIYSFGRTQQFRFSL